MTYTFTVYKTAAEIPGNWDETVGKKNILLSRKYFEVLNVSSPENMQCFYVGFFLNEKLIGGALFQFLYFLEHKTFQKSEVLCSLKNFVAKKFSRSIMILGNNMLTGQNGFYFDAAEISSENILKLIKSAAKQLQENYGKSSLIILKDYSRDFVKRFETSDFNKYYRFSVQPNMILKLNPEWRTFEDYLQAFSTKYRTRAKTARKKSGEIIKTELDLNQIIEHKKTLNILYHHVAENAPFNTFFLNENHFESMKGSLEEKFKVFGYFSGGKLVGFYTLIINSQDIDTYFLGYDKTLQKEKQLYLNMLLDMVEFGISGKFKRIIFGRTALEIKSTIGAEPVEIFGLIKHKNHLVNQFMEKIFTSVNPKTDWFQRKPFK